MVKTHNKLAIPKGVYVYLEITTFDGLCPDAIHYYGSLNYKDKDGKYDKIELRRTLNKKTAAILNKQRNDDFYVAQHTTNCFNNPQHVIRYAKSVWQKLIPDAVVLILGDYVVAEPQKILIGPKAWKKEINELAKLNELAAKKGREDIQDQIYEIWKKYWYR